MILNILYYILVINILWLTMVVGDRSGNTKYRGIEFVSLRLSINYTMPHVSPLSESHQLKTEDFLLTAYTSLHKIYMGRLLLVDNVDGGVIDHTACTPVINTHRSTWIALVLPGGSCQLETKLENALFRTNATGAIILVDRIEGSFAKQTRPAHDRIGVRLIEHSFPNIQQFNVTYPATAIIEISPNHLDNFINRTSVLFVSISFILLMIISLAWLVFYYIQRFRYIHAKERLSRRLANAAKKALSRIPVQTFRSGDPEVDSENEQCAICIESYKASDTVRILPCKHFFHKSCIDPWLLEQRSCPMCKVDILKACGVHVHHGDSLEPSTLPLSSTSPSSAPTTPPAPTRGRRFQRCRHGVRRNDRPTQRQEASFSPVALVVMTPEAGATRISSSCSESEDQELHCVSCRLLGEEKQEDLPWRQQENTGGNGGVVCSHHEVRAQLERCPSSASSSTYASVPDGGEFPSSGAMGTESADDASYVLIERRAGKPWV